MTWIDYVNNYVNENFPKELEGMKQNIINYLLTHKDEVNIYENGFDIDDIIKFMKKERNLEDTPLVMVSEDNITVKSVTNKLVDLIIENLSREVKRLKLPTAVLDKINLSEFSNLEEIEYKSSFSITEDFKSRIKNTNIKKVICRNIDKIQLQEGILFSAFRRKFISEGLTVEESDFRMEDCNFIDVYCNNPYEKIKEIMKYVDGPLGYFTIYNGFESHDHVIEYKEVTDYSTEERNKQKELKFTDFKSIKDIINVLNEFEVKGIPIDKVSIGIENKDYDDIFLIKDIENRYKCTLLLDNNFLDVVSLTDFIAMRETLNYYKNLILESGLTNVEKIMYAYDLIKSFKYQEDEKNPDNSREIYNIIRDGKIVCVGYAKFLSQLLKEVGIDSFSISTSVPIKDEIIGHQRNLIMVEDEKYGLDGLFAFDPTWDSACNLVKVVDEDGKESIKPKAKVKDGETIIKNYDNLSLYEFFLVSEREYQTVFEGEKMPNIETASFYTSSDKSNKVEVASEFSSSKRVGFDTILKIISNVKLKMGYSKEDVLNAIKEIIEIHEYRKNMEEKKDESEVVIKR